MGRLRICKCAIFAVALALYAAPQTRGKSAYLQQIGPPPLRFSPAMATLSFILPASLRERPPETNAVETASAEVKPVPTNNVPVSTPIVSATPTNNLVNLPNIPALPGPESQPTVPSEPSASDMLVISPQMLTEYFRPGSNGTNSASTLILPVPVGFTPPFAQPPSSQAIYKSK